MNLGQIVKLFRALCQQMYSNTPAMIWDAHEQRFYTIQDIRTVAMKLDGVDRPNFALAFVYDSSEPKFNEDEPV